MDPSHHFRGRIPLRSGLSQYRLIDQRTGQGSRVSVSIRRVKTDPYIVGLGQAVGLCPAVQSVLVEILIEDPIVGVIDAHERRRIKVQ